MLIQFNFKNYKSFRGETSLDLTKTKMTELETHVIDNEEEKVLKLAAIYGANASGKSNVYDAFKYMTYYVENSFRFGGESDERDIVGSYIKAEPFKFSKTSIREPSTFEVFFMDNQDIKNRTYQYGFSVNQEEVVEEWLFVKAKTAKEYKTVFYRKKGEETDYRGVKKYTENIKLSLNKEVLLLSLGTKLKIDKLKNIRDWFAQNEIISFGNPIENLYHSRHVPTGFDKDEDVQKNVVKYFSSFDEMIKSFRIEKRTKEDETKESMEIYSQHKMIDSNELAEMKLREESSGTLKMFALYPPIQKALEYGSVLFVDELNARLHPLLTRNILLTFTNPEINTNNAQLIFTTHDEWQLSSDILRRDEIWFTEKDEQGISTLYSLADFQTDDGDKIRKDESYAKNYLLGKYGAIPKIKSMDMMGGE